MAKLTGALAGGGATRRRLGDGGPAARVVVAKAAVHRSGRLGVAQNGFVWPRRSTGWSLLAPAGLHRAARRRSEAEAVVRRERGARGGGDCSRGARGSFIAEAGRARERRERLESRRTRSCGAEKTGARGASERENRRAVVEGDADRRVPRVSGGGGAADRSGGSDRTIGPNDRRWAGPRCARAGRAAARPGEPGREGIGRAARERKGEESRAGPEMKKKERERGRFGPGCENELRD